MSEKYSEELDRFYEERFTRLAVEKSERLINDLAETIDDLETKFDELKREVYYLSDEKSDYALESKIKFVEYEHEALKSKHIEMKNTIIDLEIKLAYVMKIMAAQEAVTLTQHFVVDID